MIRNLEYKDLSFVASLHKRSWQVAFRGILSDTLLDELTDKEFLSVWEEIIKINSRHNLVATLNKRPIAFVSFGASLEAKDIAEIYGIYVDPDYTSKGFGRTLMQQALEVLSGQDYSKVILWVMTKNYPAKQFYKKMGFKVSSKKRVSERKCESFEEYRFWIDLNTIE